MKRKVAWGIPFVIVMVVGVAVFTKLRVRSAPPYDQNFAASIQSGVASEAPCPSSSGAVTQAVENATWFITYRSGTTLTQQVRQRLGQLEQSSISSSTGLTAQQVRDVIAATFMNTVSSLTDDQIAEMAKSSFRVMPCVVEGRAEEVQLRASKANLDSGIFKQKAIEFRNGSTAEALSLRNVAVDLIGEAVDERCKGLAYACKDQWKVAYYSPYRVFMLAYSLVTDDPLAFSQSEVSSQMQSAANWIYSNRGIDCFSASSSPYGDHGFIYRTPTSTFFSQDVQNDLLDRIDAILLTI